MYRAVVLALAAAMGSCILAALIASLWLSLAARRQGPERPIVLRHRDLMKIFNGETLFPAESQLSRPAALLKWSGRGAMLVFVILILGSQATRYSRSSNDIGPTLQSGS